MPMGTMTALTLGLNKVVGKLKGKGGSPAEQEAIKPPDVTPQGQMTADAIAAGAKQRKRAAGGFFGNIATMLGPRLGNNGGRTTYGGGKTTLGQ